MPIKFSDGRPVMSDVTLTILVTLYIFALANATFWSKSVLYFENHPGVLASFAAGIIALHVAGLMSFSVKAL